GAVFQVLATNSFGSVTSRPALLTVLPDTCGPRLLKALSLDSQGGSNSNRVLVSFDETVSIESASVPDNYQITVVGQTNKVLITGALRLGSQVRLTLFGNLYRTNDYIL